MDFKTIDVDVADGIATLQLNQPEQANAMGEQMWLDIRDAFHWVDETPEIRVAVISGRGKHFSSGIDLAMLAGMKNEMQDECDGRAREKLRRRILDLQDTLTSIERCRKPVLAAIHGACIGGAVDLITCCDMRYASADAYFSIREIDVGMTADVGTLQRLPKLVPDGIVRELAYTGRRLDAAEAKQIGLVNRVYDSPDDLQRGVREIAAAIAAKSPLSIRGIKEMVLYSRDHSVADGLNYIATWNAAMLLSQDLTEAMTAAREKRLGKFRD
ncbi:crotonase/enoyl-CoA hydratase family protein [Paraburkholderia haematera]|uniref:Crotonyl-CoA hydratase n=1 Tax=Paraburkholderia haematera TaxID=2793077 RepID=A0ABM8R623_9BURK|nr:crotonase/enoyl-CoA hydratase family protein [Paraburkholderia haematera]CAE6734593.1 Crotonyl-CoA hydratase [Paraburkholderia haematera]